jgi:hypothetical protein
MEVKVGGKRGIEQGERKNRQRRRMEGQMWRRELGEGEGGRGRDKGEERIWRCRKRHMKESFKISREETGEERDTMTGGALIGRGRKREETVEDRETEGVKQEGEEERERRQWKRGKKKGRSKREKKKEREEREWKWEREKNEGEREERGEKSRIEERVSGKKERG